MVGHSLGTAILCKISSLWLLCIRSFGDFSNVLQIFVILKQECLIVVGLWVFILCSLFPHLWGLYCLHLQDNWRWVRLILKWLVEWKCVDCIGRFQDFDQLDLWEGKEGTWLVRSQWEFRAKHHAAWYISPKGNHYLNKIHCGNQKTYVRRLLLCMCWQYITPECQ